MRTSLSAALALMLMTAYAEPAPSPRSAEEPGFGRFSEAELSRHHHAVAHWGMGMFETAAREFDALLKELPGEPVLLLNSGSMRLSQRRYALALERLLPAAQAAPRSARASYLLGRALSGAGRKEEAAARLGEAARLDPAEPAIPFALSEIHLALGQAKAAEADLRAVLRLAPEHAPALNRLGRVLEKLGRGDEARTCLRRFAKVGRRPRQGLGRYDAPLEPAATSSTDSGDRWIEVRAVPAKPGTAAMVAVFAGREVIRGRADAKGARFKLSRPKADAVRVDWSSGEHSYEVDVEAGKVLTLSEVATHVW